MTENDCSSIVAKNPSKHYDDQNSFFAYTRHELRTPLNVIMGYSEMLIEDADSLGQPGFLPALTEINSKARSLLRLIDYNLTASRVDLDLAKLRQEMLAPFVQIEICSQRLLNEARDLGYTNYLEELGQIEMALQRFAALINELLTNCNIS